ncbi:MAG: hypothetical protein V2J07_06590 [Anaerolineae bacterium]|jgi:hypothetical protein|nr:hypothetical protein [Anaerolineae bacterium]
MNIVKRNNAKGLEVILADPERNDLEKIMGAYDYISRLIISQSEKDIELNRALGDEQAVIREQIKMSTIIHSRSILNLCHLRVIGKEIYDEYIQ